MGIQLTCHEQAEAWERQKEAWAIVFMIQWSRRKHVLIQWPEFQPTKFGFCKHLIGKRKILHGYSKDRLHYFIFSNIVIFIILLFLCVMQINIIIIPNILKCKCIIHLCKIDSYEIYMHNVKLWELSMDMVYA